MRTPVISGPGRAGTVLRQFWPQILIFVVISALSLYVIAVGSQLQVALRGAALAEGQWTRLYNEAAFHADRYTERGDPADLVAFRERLALLDGHRELRGRLMDGAVDDPVDAAALVQGAGYDPLDLPGVIALVQRYRGFGFLRRAFAYWEASDGPLENLRAVIADAEEAWAAGGPPPAALRERLLDGREALRPVREALTSMLGDASRTIRRTITAFSIVSVGSLAVLALFLISYALRRFAESEQRYRHLLNTANDGVIAIDPASGRILGCNEKVSEMTGRRETDMIGRLYRDLYPEGEREMLIDAHGRVRDGVLQLHLLHRDGRLTPVEASGSYTLWDDNEALIVIVRDVTERRAHQRRIEYLASHDPLTGLANRREFETVADGLLTERRGRGHALLYVDLDQFKVVNDTCGHAAGDEMLRQITARLRRSIRDSDTLARLGGDEFGILLVDCSLTQAEQIAAKLIAAVNDWRFTWGDKQFAVGASVGVVPLESDGAGLAALMSAADAACYAAKESGRNRVVVYRPGDSALVARQDEMGWVSRLTDALGEDRFELFCQRIVSATATSKAEAEHWELLVRLRERDGTLVEPGRFLPAAERFGLAPAIDRRVVRRALTGLRAALGAGASPKSVYAVNLSGATVCDPDFPQFVVQSFNESSVPPRMVCFEITETAAIASIDAAQLFIARMHELGCRISLDDFGSGMSSFAYLRALSVDYLKIDGMFVRDLPGDPVSAAMVRAIYELSRAIGVRTVAEFVETDAAFRHVQELGGDLAQGYAIHRPEAWPWDKG